MTSKSRVLLVGGGSIGTVTALNLELGLLASVTAVLRSNYTHVHDHGFIIKWRPTNGVDASKDARDIPHEGPPFDFVVIATKTVSDPTDFVAKLAPVIRPDTIIVLIQNGLNIERLYLTRYPKNIILSGISLTSAEEVRPGVVDQPTPDKITIGAFRNPNLDACVERQASEKFIKIYSAAGKTSCMYASDVAWDRWRKLIYNASFNPICAITGLDSGRVRLAGDSLFRLIQSAMTEIKAAAAACGHELPEDIAQTMIDGDPIEMYFLPSMLQDVRKGNLIEFEYLLGEPLKGGVKAWCRDAHYFNTVFVVPSNPVAD
ncbi:6-phosphogluconate dehydrogenase [Penicillium canescens]|nr:6-phosphogluconate dehydrogenase [Penicillium canescens]